jgi:hypothetical protein
VCNKTTKQNGIADSVTLTENINTDAFFATFVAKYKAHPVF